MIGGAGLWIGPHIPKSSGLRTYLWWTVGEKGSLKEALALLVQKKQLNRSLRESRSEDAWPTSWAGSSNEYSISYLLLHTFPLYYSPQPQVHLINAKWHYKQPFTTPLSPGQTGLEPHLSGSETTGRVIVPAPCSHINQALCGILLLQRCNWC